jgi:two-component sensor histidine kinase
MQNQNTILILPSVCRQFVDTLTRRILRRVRFLPITKSVDGFNLRQNHEKAMGLAIAQSVAETYHGALTARSDGGAVFEARFPR